jgi:hypothetical protein
MDVMGREGQLMTRFSSMDFVKFGILAADGDSVIGIWPMDLR